MANNENLTGTQGLDINPQNINKKGRPVSIKNQLKKILLKDGELPIPIRSLRKTTRNDV